MTTLTAPESLLARQITYWIGISEAGKGGSKDNLGRGWTYLSAEDLQGRLIEQDNVELSIQTIYRSLKSLVAKGWLLREKLTSHRWHQVYHYTFGPSHPEKEVKDRTDQNDQKEVIKASGSELRNLSESSSKKSIRQIAVAQEPATQQPNSIDKERQSTDTVGSNPTLSAEPDQPLTSIQGAASPELMAQLREIETNYRSRLEELKTAEAVAEATGGRLERGIHKPRVEHPDLRAHKPNSATPKGDIGKRIRELAGLYDASKVEQVSPRAVITKNGQRLRVDDGATAPLR